VGIEMKKNFLTAILMTLVTTVLLGVVYPLVVTALIQVHSPEKANGQLIYKNGVAVGSRIIAQPFTGPEYFHPRPSAAGANGYDASNSGATNLGPTNQKLIERINADSARLHAENPAQAVPIELVTTSASGLDPDISPAAANFQIDRIARARNISEVQLAQAIGQFTQQRQWSLLGEPRVNVLQLNLYLDLTFPKANNTKQAAANTNR
jgi:potassium-transporting ATPase KdpC subunit